MDLYLHFIRWCDIKFWSWMPEYWRSCPGSTDGKAAVDIYRLIIFVTARDKNKYYDIVKFYSLTFFPKLMRMATILSPLKKWRHGSKRSAKWQNFPQVFGKTKTRIKMDLSVGKSLLVRRLANTYFQHSKLLLLLKTISLAFYWLILIKDPRAPLPKMSFRLSRSPTFPSNSRIQ